MTADQWTEILKTCTALIAIVNPIGAVPLFVSLSQQLNNTERMRTIKIASISVFMVLLFVMFCGQTFLNYFGISIASFRVGGGILLLLMAISMLHGKQPQPKNTQEEIEEAITKESIAVVPLAIPMLSGPGAISSVILYADKAKTWQDYFVMALSILVVALTVFIVLSLGPKIAQILRKTGVNIISRIMGLITAAIGVEFICQGLLTLMPGLAK